ncbi:hypothetical protein [Streptomyces sp. NPDC001933]|uniref:hypothetical protein n=1 Tax=Streptomyces sp. NPDC001933 TaxID=3364626 RepID=UPI0036B107F1
MVALGAAGLVPAGALLTTVALGLGRVGPADIIGALLVAAGVFSGLRQPGPDGRDGLGARRSRASVHEPV